MRSVEEMPLEDFVMDELEQAQAETQELLLGPAPSAKKPQSKYNHYFFSFYLQNIFFEVLSPLLCWDGD